MPIRQSHLIAPLLVALLAVAGPISTAAAAAPENETVQRLARAYGLDKWDQVEAIRFTFNVHRGDTQASRAWTWEPKTGQVTLKTTAEGKAVELTYRRDQLPAPTTPPTTQPPGAIDALQADKWFINDSFWLLMPLHLTWSQDVKIESTGEAPLPIGEGKGERVVVTYPATGGGYTPGDVYELFLGPDGRIAQWVFHRGGEEKPTLATTWEDYRQVGPGWVSLDRRGAEPGFHLWFTDVAVKVDGSDRWVEPE